MTKNTKNDKKSTGKIVNNKFKYKWTVLLFSRLYHRATQWTVS